MIQSNPNAVFDCLYIGQRLERKISDFSLHEIQFFSYFSCLLSLYEGNSLNSWSYSFIKTEFGSPYSSDLEIAVSILNSAGFFSPSQNDRQFFQLSEKGNEYLKSFIASISSINWRIKYLDAACTCLSLIPLGSIKEAVNTEPVLNSAKNSTKRNLLLENNPATQVLYSQFKSLKIALEDIEDQDLLIPATVWIESLNPTQLYNSVQ